MVVRKPTYKKWWLDFQGIYIYKWHPQPSPGIWSTGTLERDAEVARVPWKLLLTRASAQDALKLSSEIGEYPSMALQLIHEKLRKKKNQNNICSSS